ncbi:MAG: UDP-glucose 4-epimerase GalE [Deltaproteobacteria bacterium]|nr:UDP-glucose 4-epimerase GalE [Deltaproteobacteria bacterium]
MDSNEKTVLVTGGGGYIGSHTCKALAESGYTPISYDNLSTGHAELVKWGPLEVGDVGDAKRVKEVLEKYRPSACIHFAGYIQVGESVLNPGRYYQNNVSGTLVLLEALLESGVMGFIFSSSAAVYGTPQTSPIPDDHLLTPINPYGESKRIVEGILGDFGTAHGMRSVSLRYFNAAGADPDGESGELHDPETHLIPLVLQAAIGKRSDITVFGDDYGTPDGTCLRDYIHVTDLARAHVLALEMIGYGVTARAFNLGNGKGFSVMEVIREAERITGKRIPVVLGGRRRGDPPVLVADSSRARVELGWAPRYPGLDEIIGTAWRFYSARETVEK